MYDIPYFKEKDPAVVLEFMKAHSFAVLTACGPDGPVATQVPLLITGDENGILLRGHIMRATDHHKALLHNPAVLCVFTGPHTYVSASHYNNPHTASTWNYMTVQAKGTIRFVDETALVAILRQTTELYENDAASPASFENLPAAYVSRLSKAIVGFEIPVTSLENVFKLSQNKTKEELRRVVAHLETGETGSVGIAKEMQKRDNGSGPY